MNTFQTSLENQSKNEPVAQDIGDEKPKEFSELDTTRVIFQDLKSGLYFYSVENIESCVCTVMVNGVKYFAEGEDLDIIDETEEWLFCEDLDDYVSVRQETTQGNYVIRYSDYERIFIPLLNGTLKSKEKKKSQKILL